MERKLNEILCRECGQPLVIEDKNGNLQWGQHERWCPAKHHPTGESPARATAKQKLICGKACQHPHTDIHSFGPDVAHCAKCPQRGLAEVARHYQMLKNGGKKPVEVIIPAPRRKPASPYKHLYFDLLVRHARLEEKLKRRGE